jgi:hypothetical protein
LNGCLCGEVLDSLTDGVLKCYQAGCETQWASLLNFIHITILTYILCSITFIVLILSWNRVIGCARLARHLSEDVEASAPGDDGHITIFPGYQDSQGEIEMIDQT